MNGIIRSKPMLCAPLIAAGAFAADWPQYYGPSRDGSSVEKGILRAWPAEGPKVLWTAPLGIGFGGAAVSGGKVYLLDRDDKTGDTLRVYGLHNGKELWTSPTRLRARWSSPDPEPRPPWTAIISTRSALLETCTASALPLKSLSGTRTSGRTLVAAAPCPPTPSRPPPRVANCRYGDCSEPARVSQSADRGLAGAPGRRSRVRQGDR